MIELSLIGFMLLYTAVALASMGIGFLIGVYFIRMKQHNAAIDAAQAEADEDMLRQQRRR